MADTAVKEASCAVNLSRGYGECGVAGRRFLLVGGAVISFILCIALMGCSIPEHIKYGNEPLESKKDYDNTGSLILNNSTGIPGTDVNIFAKRRFSSNMLISIYFSTAFSLVFLISAVYLFRTVRYDSLEPRGPAGIIDWTPTWDVTKKRSPFRAISREGFSWKDLSNNPVPNVKPFDDTFFYNNARYMKPDSNPLVYTKYDPIKKLMEETKGNETMKLFNHSQSGFEEYIKYMPCVFRPGFSCDMKDILKKGKKMKFDQVSDEYRTLMKLFNSEFLGIKTNGKFEAFKDTDKFENIFNENGFVKHNINLSSLVKDCEYNPKGTLIKKKGCSSRKKITTANNCQYCYDKTGVCSSEQRGIILGVMMLILSGFLLGIGITILVWYFDGGFGKAYNPNSSRKYEKSEEIDLVKKTNDKAWVWIGGFSAVFGFFILISSLFVIVWSKVCPRGSGWSGTDIGNWFNKAIKRMRIFSEV